MPARRWPRPLALLVPALLMLAACSGGKVRDSAPAATATAPATAAEVVPRPEPRSRYGNGPVYKVLGRTYSVLPTSAGYSERGVASWYGDKFHGQLTSNRETYDMYAMTAAHKTLPLPSYVTVRNLRNDKSVIVRVNDRGPFVHNRIIDLSYAAALKLDMIGDGTSLVEVTAISFDDPDSALPSRQTVPPPFRPDALPADRPVRSWLQVGAFGNRENADRRKVMLKHNGIDNVVVHTDTSVTPNLYRVRVGPIDEVVQYDVIVGKLEKLGITDPYLVPE